MKKTTIIVFLIFLQSITYAQTKDSLLDMREKLIEIEKSNSNLRHELDKSNIEVENLNNRITELITASEDRSMAAIEKVDSKYGNYLVFGGILLTICVFFINYYGRKLIRGKVELIIEKTATLYAAKKTDEVIAEKINDEKIIDTIKEKGAPAISQLLAELQTRGSSVITGIKQRGEAALSSMLATQLNAEPEGTKDKSDSQIEKINRKTRGQEFFDLAMESKDYIVQIELYKKVLELEPTNVNALNNIGVSYSNTYKYNEAIESLEKGLKIKPDFGLLYANLAHALNQLNRLDEAYTNIQRALDLKANLDWTYSVKGNIHTKRKENKEAQEAFDLAIAHNPNSAEAFFTRGYFYEETGKFDLSEADYLKSQELGFTNKALLYNNFAVLYRRKKEFDTAITYLEKARTENPEFGNIDGTLALIYADQGMTEEFYHHLEIALVKGCPAWSYTHDPGFANYLDDERLKKLFKKYKK